MDLRPVKGFLEAYQRSARRYTVIRGAVGDPDPFRVKYREAIAEQVAEIIRARCGRREAVERLRFRAEDSVVESDRKRFVATAEETLAGMITFSSLLAIVSDREGQAGVRGLGLRLRPPGGGGWGKIGEIRDSGLKL